MTLRSFFAKLTRPAPLIGGMLATVGAVLLLKSQNVSPGPDEPYWRNQEYAQLTLGNAFEKLDEGSKSLTYHLNRAAWFGSFISAAQTSPESPCLMVVVLSALKLGFDARMDKAGFEVEERQKFRRYSCGILASHGNYRGDDSVRFIPEEIDPEKLQKFFKDVWPSVPASLVTDAMKSTPTVLGFPPEGQTQYWRGMNSDEAESVVKFMQNKGIMIGNQFAVMTNNASGKFVNVRFGSKLKTTDSWEWKQLEGQPWEGFTKVSLSRGAYSGILTLIIEELELAVPLATNEDIKEYLKLLIESLNTGDLGRHVAAGKSWVKALNQRTDSYMGFQENYRDPKGLQLEYVSFVGIEDSNHSKVFGDLIRKGADLTAKLPWSADFEPDPTTQTGSKSFSSILAMSYVTNIPPRGVNLPDYEEVKREGQKNFNIANVVAGKAKFLVLAFLSEKDREVLKRLYIEAFTVKLGLHELLGHGSGKILREYENGTTNFAEDLKDPTTNSTISRWYKPGETFASVFGSIASAYEELRANCIALYLACEPDVLKIFGHEGARVRGVCLAVYLNQIFTGLTSLAYYDTKAGWLSAHAQSEFIIMRRLVESLPGFVDIKEVGTDDLDVTINRDMIPGRTTDAFKDFVLKIQIYRLTGNIQAAEQLFNSLSEVDGKWSRLRQIVVNKKAGLKEPSFIQGNIQVKDPDPDDPVYKWTDYDASCDGLLASWKNRFSLSEVEAIKKAVEDYIQDDG